MKESGASQGQSATELISKRIAELGDWRGETLSRMRKLIKEADPDVVEEWKWMGTPVWSHDGIICTGESYKKASPVWRCASQGDNSFLLLLMLLILFCITSFE